MSEFKPEPITSRFSGLRTVRSPLREIDARLVDNDEELLKEIGYKQEMKRSYSTLQTFGIAFSIMGLLPSIATSMGTGLSLLSPGLVWGWFVAPFFILSVGTTMAEMASSIPTSGGLYYWTNHYAPDSIRVPLSYLVGFSNSIGLCVGTCSVNYGFASEVLAAVYLNTDGAVTPTVAKKYGVFAATMVLHSTLIILSKGRTATVQTVSVVCNLAIIVLFFIAVPIGRKVNVGSFNDASFIFGDITNFGEWNVGWEFCLGMMVPIWTIGAFDSVVHMSEELKSTLVVDPNAKISFFRMLIQSPYAVGIMGSITACWVLGWFICIVIGACMSPDPMVDIATPTGMPIAQIINDCLGKRWAVLFMVLICCCQFLMGASLLLASSRQIWAFARDNGLPFSRYIKYVNKRYRQPFNSVIFACIVSLLLNLIVLLGDVAANLLFSLALLLVSFSWVVPMFLRLTFGKSKFKPGPFYLGDVMSLVVGWLSVLWICFVLILCNFPSVKKVSGSTMNYTIAVLPGVWILSMVYFWVYKRKRYFGPISNLDDDSAEDIRELETTSEIVGKDEEHVIEIRSMLGSHSN